MPDAPAAPVAVKEGARWRYVRPSSDEVADWFKSVPLDEGMEHESFVSGIVLIPAKEKVERTSADGRRVEEVYELTFTPYVRVDTRVAYLHNLAEAREQIAVIEPVQVPQIDQGALANNNMPEGFWWHAMGEAGRAARFLCATWRVALYRREDWFDPSNTLPRPLREGRGTKQVNESLRSGLDLNALAKAETGAIGRALGVAGILVVGTGIATAEDMQELREAPDTQPVALPAPGAPEETEEQLNERLVTLEVLLRPYAEQWREFTAWWKERATASGWTVVGDAPVEARRGVATKMQSLVNEAQLNSSQDSSPVEPADG